MGRPSSFTQETADRICEQLALGHSMRTVCAGEEMPAMTTVFKWLREMPAFAQQYARAKEEAADVLAEDIISIADDGSNDTQVDEDGNPVVNFDHIQRSKLRVEARKWIAAKLKPKKYGDKLQQDVSLTVNDALADRLTKAQERISPPAADDHG